MIYAVAVSVLLAGVAGTVRLLVSPDPLAEGSAALIAISLMVASAVSVGGLALVRARWARRLAVGLMAGQLALTLALESSVAGWVALGATALGVVLLLGPWLDTSLRQLPVAEPIPPASMALAIGLLIVPAVLGLSAPGGPRSWHWAAAGMALLFGWGYARAMSTGLWGIRLGVPVALAAAAVQSPIGGAVLLGAVAMSLVALAWSPGAGQAIRPLIPAAPGVAIPPELVPPGLLAEAGYDERGRPRRKRDDDAN